MKQWILILTIYLPNFLLAQHADIEGDTRITGKLEIIHAVGDSNIFIGANVGINSVVGGPTSGRFNTFIGNNSGRQNSTGNHNTFIGRNSGLLNTTGSLNSFFGSFTGTHNTSARGNSFFGAFSGEENTTGSDNSFIGLLSGNQNTTGENNSFFGVVAGESNTSGDQNSFFGVGSGSRNTTGEENSFFGVNSGADNISGSDNTFLGNYSGDSNKSGNKNTLLGYNASIDLGLDSLDRSIAIGYNAKVGCHNCAVIGGTNENAVNVGIGTSSPEERLSIEGERTAFIKMQALDYDAEVLFGANFFGAQLRTISNHDIEFFTNDTKRMTLTNTGELGIGIDDADGKLHVFGSSADNTLLRLTDAGHINGGFTLTGTATSIPGLKHFRIMNREDGEMQFGTKNKFIAKLTTESFEPEATNDIDLGTSNSRWKTLFVSNGVNNSSDLRLKTDIQPLKYGLATLQNLNPVSYRWISNTSEEKLGLIAQEVLKVIPEVVNQPSDPDLMMGLDYTELIPVLIKAILELKEEVDSLKKTD